MLRALRITAVSCREHVHCYQRALKTVGNLRPARNLNLNAARLMALTSTESLQVFIDCDAGVDDAQGLIAALRHPGTHVTGISAVNGNVECEKVVTNIARVLALCKADVPYYVGCNRPMLGQSLPATFWHGKDGLGDVPDTYPAVRDVKVAPSKVHASLAIVEAAKKYRGQLRLVAIGPLTNIAVALKLEPQLPELLHSFTIMGGCDGGGNVTPTAEFNVHCDPEAAQAVLAAFKKTRIITWDAVIKLALPWSVYDEWVQKGKSKQADFLEAVGRIGLAHDKGKDSDSMWLVCDPLAVMAAISPELVTKEKTAWCNVELQGSLTRGQTVFDFNAPKEKHNVQVVTEMDMKGVMRLLSDSVS